MCGRGLLEEVEKGGGTSMKETTEKIAEHRPVSRRPHRKQGIKGWSDGPTHR